MRPLVVRHRILIVVAVVIVAIGGLWWTKTIAFTRSSPVAFTAETFVYVPRGDPSDITPTVIAAFPFSNDEIVRLVAERIVNTYGGNRSEYASSLTIKDTTAVAGEGGVRPRPDATLDSTDRELRRRGPLRFSQRSSLRAHRPGACRVHGVHRLTSLSALHTVTSMYSEGGQDVPPPGRRRKRFPRQKY